MQIVNNFFEKKIKKFNYTLQIECSHIFISKINKYFIFDLLDRTRQMVDLSGFRLGWPRAISVEADERESPISSRVEKSVQVF